MHLNQNKGIEGITLVVTAGLGFVDSALCLELARRGAGLVRAFNLRSSSPWSENLLASIASNYSGTITTLSSIWIPPQPGYVKCNTDASLKDKKVGLAVVVRNHRKDFTFVHCKYVNELEGGDKDIEEVELKAIELTIELIKEMK